MLLTVDGRIENACIAKAPLAISCEISTTNSFSVRFPKASRNLRCFARIYSANSCSEFGISSGPHACLFADHSRRFSAASSELCRGCKFSTRRILPRDCNSATRVYRSACNMFNICWRLVTCEVTSCGGTGWLEPLSCSPNIFFTFSCASDNKRSSTRRSSSISFRRRSERVMNFRASSDDKLEGKVHFHPNWDETGTFHPKFFTPKTTFIPTASATFIPTASDHFHPKPPSSQNHFHPRHTHTNRHPQTHTPTQTHTRLLGRRGFTRQPENSQRAHFRAPALQKHHPNSTKGPPRERRKKENCGGGEGESAKFWALPPFGPPPFGAPPHTPTHSNTHPHTDTHQHTQHTPTHTNTHPHTPKPHHHPTAWEGAGVWMKVVWDESGHGMKVVWDERGIVMKFSRLG